jgi:hypothetical protein
MILVPCISFSYACLMIECGLHLEIAFFVHLPKDAVCVRARVRACVCVCTTCPKSSYFVYITMHICTKEFVFQECGGVIQTSQKLLVSSIIQIM